MKPEFSLSTRAVVIGLGIITGCVAALQPLLLGSLLITNQLSTYQVGIAAAAESLCSVLSMTLATTFLPLKRLRSIACGALLIAALVNTVTGFMSGWQIILLRVLNGMCSGMLVWILLAFLARSDNPGRFFAIYITCQTILTFLFAQVLSNWLLPVYGSVGGYSLFVISDLILILFSLLFLSSELEPAPNQQRRWPPKHGLFGLFSVGFQLAAILGFWVYVIPIGLAFGHSFTDLKTSISWAIGLQIAAGSLAIYISGKIDPIKVCYLASGTLFCLIVVFSVVSGYTLLILCCFAFVWMFLPSFQLPALLEIDASSRSAMFIGSAQQLGVASGPLIISQVISLFSISAAPYTALACVVASVVFMFLSRRSSMR